jgi:hypothetical protein
VTVIPSCGLHQAQPTAPSVDVVGHMQHQAHVRIRDMDLVYAALQYERCFDVVLGGRMGVAAKVLLAVPPSGGLFRLR